MPRGSSPKREKEYKEILGNVKKRGEYKGREEEVAARIVNKQRREAGETKARKSGGSRSGSSRTRTGRSTTKSRSTHSGAKGRSTRSSSSRTRSSSKRK